MMKRIGHFGFLVFSMMFAILVATTFAIPIFYALMTFLAKHGFATFYTFPSIARTISYNGFFLYIVFLVALLIEVTVTLIFTMMLKIPITNQSIKKSTVIQAILALFLIKYSIEPMFDHIHLSWPAAILFTSLFYLITFYLNGDDQIEEKLYSKKD